MSTFSSYQHLEFHSKIKGILRSQWIYSPIWIAGAAFFRSEINSYLRISVIAGISGTNLERSEKIPDYLDDV